MAGRKKRNQFHSPAQGARSLPSGLRWEGDVPGSEQTEAQGNACSLQHQLRRVTHRQSPALHRARDIEESASHEHFATINAGCWTEVT